MRILLCAIVALPLVLFGVENADNANTINQTTLDSNKGNKGNKGYSGDSKDTKDAKDSSESHESANESAKDSANDSMQSPKSTKDSLDSNADATAESPSISTITNTTKEESGFMLGIGAIMGGPVGKAQGELGGVLGGPQKRFDYGLEVLLGHKTFFGESGIFGMRLYIDYNYRKSRGVEMSSHFLGLNIDTLWNFTQGEIFKFGVLLGVRSGIGYGLGDVYNKEVDVDWTADLNIGARFVIYDHNAFELLLQPRFGLWLLKGKNSMYGIVRYVYTF